jgi:RimJ/RimL family protein N-acetyltransferase
MSGYPGVAVVTIFVDPDRARAGVAMEAFAIYVGHVFDLGARLVHFEVLESNAGVLKMFRSIGAAASARMREHLYAGGGFHDVLVFSMTRDQFERARARFSSMLPGGERPPAALGGVRREHSEKNRQK